MGMKGNPNYGTQFKKDFYPNGIENSQAFANHYQKLYGKHRAKCIFTKVQDNVSECGGRQIKRYFLTHGLLINFYHPYNEDKVIEFQEKIIELAKEYDEICQISRSESVNMVVPEEHRKRQIIKRMLHNNSSKKRIERYKKVIKRKEIFKYKGVIKKNVKDFLKNLTPYCYGEYYKNSIDEELIVLTDGTKISKEMQAKSMQPDLFWHLVQYELLEIIDDRELYKKFYFREELIKNFTKYLPLFKRKIKK